MSARECLPAAVLKRKAVVYVRQSTSAQVYGNLESQRRQYELAGSRALDPEPAGACAAQRSRGEGGATVRLGARQHPASEGRG